MCEIFALSSRYPATVDFCLAEFARHGGLTGPHSDGWGLAYYAEDGAVRMFKEAEPASRSDWVQFIKEHHMRAAVMLSHIRRATQGARSLKNTHPFRRELGGRCHVFVHNGHLDDIKARPDLKLGFHHPLGDTDSEYAFCALLGQLQEPWISGTIVPPLEQRLGIVTRFARSLRRLGIANFVYADGDAVFVHGNRRRSNPTKPPRAPGLYVLQRTCGQDRNRFCTGGLQIAAAGSQDMVLAASVPLTDEEWRPLKPGEVLVLRAGRIAARAR